jgi:hypothetical protein
MENKMKNENRIEFKGKAYVAISAPNKCDFCDLKNTEACTPLFQCREWARKDNKEVVWKKENQKQKDLKHTMTFPKAVLTDDMNLKEMWRELSGVCDSVRNIQISAVQNKHIYFSYTSGEKGNNDSFSTTFKNGKLELIRTPWGIKEMKE